VIPDLSVTNRLLLRPVTRVMGERDGATTTPIVERVLGRKAS
jgi:hypothetical protein